MSWLFCPIRSNRNTGLPSGFRTVSFGGTDCRVTRPTRPTRLARLALCGTVLSTMAVSLSEGATYQVGPGRTYTTLQAVATLLLPGDLVEVDGNVTYPGDATFRRPGTAAQPIVIRGITVAGRRPILSGGTNTIHFRTDDIGSGADHYVLDNFEITGGASRCVYHQASDLTLRNLLVHDCPKQGILGADWGSGSLTLEFSEVYRCGGGDRDHQIYMATDQDNYPGAVFRMQWNYVHDSNGGNNVKSRAGRNEIYYNRIEGAYYHELELIGAECCAEEVVQENSDVVGNILVKRGSNATFPVARVGGDGTGQSFGRYRFVNNTVIVAGAGAVFRVFDGIESLEAHNNVFFMTGGGPVNIERTVEADWRFGRQVAGSNNWVTTGSTNVPSEWSGTLSGADPGFANSTAGNFTPVVGSPLLNGATSTPSGPVGYPFPLPLFPPAYHPPARGAVTSVAVARPVSGALDIGALEVASALPRLRLGDATVAEGDSGTRQLTITVTLE